MMTMWGLWIGAASLVGCSRGDSLVVEDDLIEAAVDGTALENRIEGTWRVVVATQRARRLAIIDAALSAEPLRVQGLGKLSKDEKDLYETWSRKRGTDVRKMEKKLRMTRARYVVTDGRITVQVDNEGVLESYGPVDYDTLESSGSRTVLRFDPGMGNGYETHTVIWQGPDRGTDRVTADGQSLIELPLVREAGPAEATPAAD